MSERPNSRREKISGGCAEILKSIQGEPIRHELEGPCRGAQQTHYETGMLPLYIQRCLGTLWPLQR